MVEKFVVFDALTGETRIEEIEVEVPYIKEDEILPTPTLEDKVRELEEVNAMQDELINVSLMATDEIFCMLEPLLTEINLFTTRGNSKMVDMYVAMVQRGLKTIENVPLRYREEVKRILEALEK
ncbi:MAG: hypothetical protein IJH55_00105 [Romboutsia sp.]|nr:hypothetical protein [Romboutsia sp.]